MWSACCGPLAVRWWKPGYCCLVVPRCVGVGAVAVVAGRCRPLCARLCARPAMLHHGIGISFLLWWWVFAWPAGFGIARWLKGACLACGGALTRSPPLCPRAGCCCRARLAVGCIAAADALTDWNAYLGLRWSRKRSCGLWSWARGCCWVWCWPLLRKAGECEPPRSPVRRSWVGRSCVGRGCGSC